MDEIDLIKNTKKALITFTKIFVGIGTFFALIILIDSRYTLEDKKALLFLALLIGAGLPSILVISYFIINIFSKTVNAGTTIINFDKQYIRDLPKHCSPAISSLIYDLKIDVYKDYTATLLYLCNKKYINLVKNVDTYKLELLNSVDYSNLGRCEKYVLDIIKNKNKFDESQFKKEIIKEAQEMNLITDKKHSKFLRIVLFLILALLLLIITYNINKMLFTILFSIVGAIVYVIYFFAKVNYENQNTFNVIDTGYIRTKDGKNMALILKGLKKYIKEYTLIKDKEIKYIQILENYIPYALALGEADTVEEFIKHNEEYRDLIYNKKSTQ